MRLYAAVGRLPDALRQYQELERVLRMELQSGPSAAARELRRELEREAVSSHQDTAAGFDRDEPRLPHPDPAPA